MRTISTCAAVLAALSVSACAWQDHDHSGIDANTAEIEATQWAVNTNADAIEANTAAIVRNVEDDATIAALADENRTRIDALHEKIDRLFATMARK